jgi:SsrA-binding protein
VASTIVLVGKSKKSGVGEIRNGKVFHDYFVGETFEAGIVLLGQEVKSLRGGHGQLGDAFVRPNGRGELFLYNFHIAGYEFSENEEYNGTRPRKLLLHGGEIGKIIAAMERAKRVVIPLRVFFKHGLAKVAIALCSGKKLFDKREDLRKKEAAREVARAMARRT